MGGLRPASALREMNCTRSSCTSRALSSIDTRAALCTTRLSAIVTRTPTEAMATVIFQRIPVRRVNRLMP